LIPSGWYKITDTLILSTLLRLRGETARMSVLEPVINFCERVIGA
jgi:hypothetical protein